jgi:hypothetical protein
MGVITWMKRSNMAMLPLLSVRHGNISPLEFDHLNEKIYHGNDVPNECNYLDEKTHHGNVAS